MIESSISRKVAMALSGLFLILFLAQHFTINFNSVFSEDLFNKLSHFMGTNPLVQFILQPILILGVIFHFVMGFILEIKNRRSRKVNYSYQSGISSSWISRNMFFSGIVILSFLGLHFYDFWVPEIKYKYIEFLPDVAPGAQLASPLVGLYPFGTTFDPPVKFRFTFDALTRQGSEYKLLYMDDIQTGDWEELGDCSGEELGFCKVDELSSSGLFIVMYGENLNIDELGIPFNFNLYRSYPNPFNPTTTLEFDVSNSGLINFIVYNLNGKIVETISPKFYTPGNYQIKWNAKDLPSGIYLVQMKTESSSHLQKVMLLK